MTLPPSEFQFEQVTSFQSLYEAHLLARRGKRSCGEVAEFELDLGRNIVELSRALREGAYRPLPFVRFVVDDPKRRVVHAPRHRDRVVQRSLCDNALGPVLEPRLVYDNAACRAGKGTHFALDRLECFMRDHVREHGPQGWFLKCDVRRFFASVDHARLKGRLARLPLGGATLDLLYLFVDGSSLGGSVVRGGERGLPLGCQTSQWLALYYLDGLDRLVKERLRVHAYTRYMDDMVLVHPDRAFLRGCLDRMRAFAADELGLEFNDKTQVAPLSQGIDYLGFHLYVSRDGRAVRRLRQAAKRRLKARLRFLDRGVATGAVPPEEALSVLESLLAHLAHGDCRGLEREVAGLSRRVADAGRPDAAQARPVRPAGVP